ncbi:hypothetical protein LELG_04408 [Lodderomyces elongisporus NRRL YB-4239]|uniref:Uncharacterized protein n=1 Tax=Lodderomyces elongisporus (strain ATCC 11503 / CBS 2605 / JCM 1781 / NBRC 1676 / NRRL YB-4239) TaxID=379508 RepID=A5E469_LODEL|nr:hypothetical protein LELG_04408 [Lodderomyces elongisporus NRRL YB-4239]
MLTTNFRINKSKSFDDQILDLQIVDKVFLKTSFTGKCQVIVNKIHEADSILQIWNKERKPLKSNLFKLLVEAIFVLGPDIAYYHMFKMEPLMNQYFEFLNNQPLQPKQKKHTVSTFFAGKTTTVSNAHAWQVKLIKGFIAMLRHEYKEAADLFAESVEIYNNDIDNNNNNNGNNNGNNSSKNSDNDSDINNTNNKCNLAFSSKTAFLGCLCQANEANQSKKQLEVLAIKISNSPLNSALKYQVLAKVYHKLHVLEKQKTRKSILKTFKPNNRDMALKCYISAATLAEEDNLLIAEYYDNILNFLVGEIRECIGSSKNTGKGNNKAHNHLRMRYLVFFYQVRNLFCLYSDYNYLHIPGLVCDWQVVKQDEKILNKIQQYVDGTNEISDDEEEENEENEDDDRNDENDDNSTVPRDTTMRSIRSTPKSANQSEMPPDKLFDLIDYWVKEYQTYKGEIPDAVKKFMPS